MVRDGGDQSSADLAPSKITSGTGKVSNGSAWVSARQRLPVAPTGADLDVAGAQLLFFGSAGGVGVLGRVEEGKIADGKAAVAAKKKKGERERGGYGAVERVASALEWCGWA